MSTISSAGTITSAGVGSGLDVEGIITKLMAIEQAPLTALQKRQATYNSEISALGQVKSDLSALQTAVQAFSSGNNVYSYQASVAAVGTTTVASAAANTNAVGGTYSLEVQQLATSEKLMSAAGADPSAGGTLTIDIGSVTGGVFTSTSSVNVTLGAGGTLNDLASAINSANAGVSATVISGASGNQLVVTSQTSGAAGKIRISSADLTAFTYDPTSGTNSMSETTAGQDAIVYLDGVKVANTSSNTVTDAVTGVTLNLLATNTGNPTTLTVANDPSALETKLNAFVTAYNNLQSLVKGLTGYDSSTGNSGALNGDTTVAQVMNSLRSAIFNTPAGASTSYQTLSSLGIQFQADGSLQLDTPTLETAMSTNFSAVAATIKSFGGAINTSLTSALDIQGPIATDTNGINNMISDIKDREDQLNVQLTAIEARYRAQFTALDTLMSQMQTTSSYLTQQLAALTKSGSSG